MNRINLICLGVTDLKNSLSFYKEIGFQTFADDDATIVFFNNQGSKLELFQIEELAKDINYSNPPHIVRDGFTGITLSCNMKSREEVDDLFKLVKSVGGLISKEPEIFSWGGYSGCFQDPDDYYWEVAYSENWKFDENDKLIID